MGLEVRVLGPLEVVDEGNTVVLPGRKHRRLLVALVLAGGRVVSVDSLADAVWGESPPASARKLLQLYVSQLRKVLPEGTILTDEPGYALEVKGGAIDAVRFERLSHEAAAALAGDNPALGASLAERALALWRGPAYADVVYEEFARAEAERLEELRLGAIEDRLDAQLRLGRHETVLPETVALADQHVLRERLEGLAMLALYRSGRQTEALDRYADLRRRLDEELGLEPGPVLRALQQRILRQDSDLDGEGPPASDTSSLPASPTTLVGRASELVQLHDLLARRDARLVVLTGAGGSGKTRLALEAAREAASSYANGVVLVELAPLRDPALVAVTVAQALDVDEVAGEAPEETLVGALADRELLLVVDNAEHLRDAAPLYAHLVARVPRLTVLVTSRAVLHISGEHVFPVAPLPEADAVELFVQRARLLEASFERTDQNGPELREICRRLDGLPLAIELAAARIRTLTPRLLVQRLSERLTLLTSGPRDLPARQQTLRETIGWSVGLLTAAERRVFARLAVFPAGATLEAAEAVCGADVDILGALVDGNVARRVDVDGEPRFGMLETVREYALELLGAERHDAELAMAGFLAELTDRVEFEVRLSSRVPEPLDPEIDNLRAALAATEASSAAELRLRLAGNLWRYCWVRGSSAEGLAWIEQALAAADGAQTVALARALQGGAGLAWSLGDWERAKELAREAIPVAAAAGSLWDEMAANTVLGIVANNEGDRAASRVHHRRSMELAEQQGLEPFAQKVNLGVVALDCEEYEEARVLFDDVLAYHSRAGNAQGMGFALINLGVVHHALGDHDASLRAFREGRDRFEEVGFRAHVAHALQGFAAFEASEGRLEEAARLLGQARAELDDVGASEDDFAAEMVAWTKQQVRKALGDHGLEIAYEDGRAGG